MAKSTGKPKRRPGKFNPLRLGKRRKRELVPATPGRDRDRPDDDLGGGAAGVREPRRPKPGPFSAAAEADEPEERYLDLTSYGR